MELYLCLLSFPSNIYRVNASYTIRLIETETIYESPYTAFTKYNWYHAWPLHLLKSQCLEELESITLECTMNSLFTEPKMPLSPSLTLPPPQSTYRWIVDDEDTMNLMQSAPNVHGFASPIFEMFGLRFYLVLYPNGSKITRKGTPNLFLNIASLRYGDMAVHVDQTVFIMNSYDRCIARHGMTSRGRGLLNSAGNFADWKGYDRYSFMVHIALIDVYRPADIDKSILAEYMDGIGDGDGVKVHEVPSREYVWECPLVFAINQPFGGAALECTSRETLIVGGAVSV